MTKKRGFLYNRSWADTGPLRSRDELRKDYVPLNERGFEGKVIVLNNEVLAKPRRAK